jgi:hypothetical protein
MSSLSYSETSSLLVYGSPGIGKTSLVFSFTPAKKRFVFDLEAGLKVVAHMPASVFRVTTYTDLTRAINYLEQDTEHDVVIVDSLTELARVVMVGALGLPAAGAGRPFPEVPVLQDWSLTIERLRNSVRRIRLLIYKGKWVFFTAAAGINKDQNTGRLIGGPELPGKDLPNEVCYLMDEVYRMDVQQTTSGPQRVFWTQPDSIWLAKTRVRGAPPMQGVTKKGVDVDPTTLNFLRRA